jgi:hypothetical protein
VGVPDSHRHRLPSLEHQYSPEVRLIGTFIDPSQARYLA